MLGAPDIGIEEILTRDVKDPNGVLCLVTFSVLCCKISDIFRKSGCPCEKNLPARSLHRQKKSPLYHLTKEQNYGKIKTMYCSVGSCAVLYRCIASRVAAPSLFISSRSAIQEQMYKSQKKFL